MRKITVFAIFLFIVCSCASTKKTVYFQGVDQADISAAATSYEVRIMPNDNLHITVSSINPEAAEIFNTMNLSGATTVNNEALNMSGYLIDSDGYINFPVLGDIMLGGKTKSEAIDYMTGLISDYIENPVVNIRLINYKVTILGEVSKPGTYKIRDEKVTLLEALGMAGDMTIYGKRRNVLLVREKDGVKNAYRLDMRSPDVLTSDFYYLQQNDVVYVQPNRAKSGSSSYNQNLSVGVSMLSLLTTIAVLVDKNTKSTNKQKDKE